MLEARSAVRQLKQYQPPLGDRSGLRLDFNENTGGCSPRVIERLRTLQPEQLACYPEREPVEHEVASFLGLRPEQVLLTNGVDEAIHLLCEAYLEAEDEALIVVPTFAMYRICAGATGARVISIPADADFRFPTSKVMAYTTAPKTRFIAIANPNNPTGAVASTEDLLLIARSAPQAAVLVDEAYFEFHGESLLEYAGQVPNLFVARTFSKAYGMASLRVGVLAGAVEQVQNLRRACSPYNVNGVALACLPAALADQEYVRRYVAEAQASRNRLEEEFRVLGVPFWPSRANFVLARIGSRHADFVRGMRARGILVRDRSSDFGCDGCVRITAGWQEHTEPLLGALHETLKEIGWGERTPA
ncbi:MAG: pyridoxal phosphate-dependent aminotransferase [Terriglobales bacterium]